MIYQFKTNINCGSCVASVTPHLNANKELKSWEIDTLSPQIKKNAIKCLVLQCLLLLTFSMISAQGKEMFIEQIQGKTIARENFNNSGKVISRQEFVVGQLQQSGKTYLLNIQTKLYDEAGKLESTYSSTYTCQPGESNVLLSVFSVKPQKQIISVSVKSGDFKKLYDLSQADFQKTLSFTMYVESGILNFLGSKNVVTIADRSLSETNDQLIVKSSLIIKAYLLGISIKTIKYSTTEILSQRGLLQKQIFKASDGSYFTMNYQ